MISDTTKAAGISTTSATRNQRFERSHSARHRAPVRVGSSSTRSSTSSCGQIDDDLDDAVEASIAQPGRNPQDGFTGSVQLDHVGRQLDEDRPGRREARVDEVSSSTPSRAAARGVAHPSTKRFDVEDLGCGRRRQCRVGDEPDPVGRSAPLVELDLVGEEGLVHRSDEVLRHDLVADHSPRRERRLDGRSTESSPSRRTRLPAAPRRRGCPRPSGRARSVCTPLVIAHPSRRSAR